MSVKTATVLTLTVLLCGAVMAGWESAPPPAK
jgi:hypothetical protein